MGSLLHGPLTDNRDQCTSATPNWFPRPVGESQSWLRVLFCKTIPTPARTQAHTHSEALTLTGYMPSPPFLSQVTSRAHHNPQTLSCTSFLLQLSWFSFFCSKYQLLARLPGKEKEELCGVGVISLPRRVQRKGGGEYGQPVLSITAFPSLGKYLLVSSRLLAGVLPTSYPCRQKHGHTQVWVQGESCRE